MKAQLLYLLRNPLGGEDKYDGIRGVLLSGLLPNAQLQKWLDSIVERVVHAVCRNSGCPELESWTAHWLACRDNTSTDWEDWAKEAAWALWVSADTVDAAEIADAVERKTQFDTLFKLIKELSDENCYKNN